MPAPKQPWSRLAAILIGSYATLIGLWSQLDPEIILFRSLVAAAAAAVMAKVVVGLAPLSREVE